MDDFGSDVGECHTALLLFTPIVETKMASHATPGDLDIGFENHGSWNMIMNETLDVTDFNKEAFSKNSNANLVGGCRTAVTGNLPFERSVAEQMSDKVGGVVKASDVRVYYPGGVVSDKQLVKKNNGNSWSFKVETNE